MGTTGVIHLCFCKFHIWALIIPTFTSTVQLPMASRKQHQNCISLLRAIPSYFSQTHCTTSALHIMHTHQICHTLGKCKNGSEQSKHSSGIGREGGRISTGQQPLEGQCLCYLTGTSFPLKSISLPQSRTITEQIALQCDQWLRNPDYQLGKDLLLKNSTESIFRGTASFRSGR